MFALLKNELQYERYSILVYPVLLVAFYSYKLADNSQADFLIVLFAFLFSNNFLSRMKLENRENRFAVLPVSPRSVAVFRMLIVTVPFATVIIIHAVTAYLAAGMADFDFRPVFIFSSLILFFYALYFVTDDLFSGRIFSGGTFDPAKLFMMGLIAFTLLGLVALYSMIKNGKEIPAYIEVIISIMKSVFSYYGIVLLFALAVVLFIAGIFTYERKRFFTLNR